MRHDVSTRRYAEADEILARADGEADGAADDDPALVAALQRLDAAAKLRLALRVSRGSFDSLLRGATTVTS